MAEQQRPPQGEPGPRGVRHLDREASAALVQELAGRQGDVRPIRFMLAVQGALGIATICVGIASLLFEDEVTEFVDIFLGTIDPTFKAVWRLVLVAPIVSGLFVLASAAGAISLARANSANNGASTASLACIEKHCYNAACERQCGSTSRGYFHAALIIMVLLFLGQLLFAGGFIIFLNSLGEAVEDIAVSEDLDTLDEFQAEVSTLQLAIFNLCCFEAGWSGQGEIQRCPRSGSVPKDCQVPPGVERFRDSLCTCYTSPSYAEFYDTLAEDKRVCEVLSNSIVVINGRDQVPGTNIPVNFFFPTERFRIVGFNGTDEEDTITENEPRGYGCGQGLAKPFQWAQFHYVSTKTYTISTLLVCISVAELLVLLMAVCELRASSDDEFFQEMQSKLAQGRRRASSTLPQTSRYKLSSPFRSPFSKRRGKTRSQPIVVSPLDLSVSSSPGSVEDGDQDLEAGTGAPAEKASSSSRSLASSRSGSTTGSQNSLPPSSPADDLAAEAHISRHASRTSVASSRSSRRSRHSAASKRASRASSAGQPDDNGEVVADIEDETVLTNRAEVDTKDETVVTNRAEVEADVDDAGLAAHSEQAAEFGTAVDPSLFRATRHAPPPPRPPSPEVVRIERPGTPDF